MVKRRFGPEGGLRADCLGFRTPLGNEGAILLASRNALAVGAGTDVAFVIDVIALFDRSLHDKGL